MIAHPGEAGPGRGPLRRGGARAGDRGEGKPPPVRGHGGGAHTHWWTAAVGGPRRSPVAYQSVFDEDDEEPVKRRTR